MTALATNLLATLNGLECYIRYRFNQIQQNIFGKTLIEVCSLHLYASFGTFCVQIGQIFAPQ